MSKTIVLKPAHAVAEQIIEAGILKHNFEICLMVLIIFTVLYFSLGNYLTEVPEPEAWIAYEKLERHFLIWLYETIFTK